CWLPPEILAGRRLWGVAAQLYLLRSAGNWGIGDFGDLRTLVDLLKKKGADVLGLNPLHALFADDPEHASPYSPASRLLLNVLNIDVAAIAELADCAEAIETINSSSFQSSMQRCRDAPLVEYSAVTRLKMGVLQRIYAHCRANSHSPHWREFIAFRRSQSEAVERAYLFLALRSHFTEQPGGHADWHRWPAEYRDPSDPRVRAFAEQHLDKVAFQAWLQFIADEQLGRAAAAAEPMAIGLYRDLAVGADRCGAETWADSSAVVDSAAVGAPPDIYNPPGQNWGLPPLNPRTLRDQAYRSFIDLIRANMRHAGGLRIDHVMALQQLYWVPQGLEPSEGAYVRYPLRDLVGILALESRRQRCLVVGEDLGTVPEGFRERMAAANVLSYRVLFFERDTDGFLPPDSYPHLALAVAGSHDLPTLRSWWEDADLRLKETLRLFPKSEDARRAWSERGRDRKDLLAALSRAGLPSDPTMTVELLNQAAHAYLGRSTAALAVAQLDDLTDEATPVNVPTTSQEHPNWRRRLSLSLEELATLPRLDRLADIFRKERAHSPPRGESI
ncbi:MAG: 4-alpha-glucanotransferase, partial [Pseudomonadota bacterium]|nr:4-alpha-glucanotransferase [Pseudomonadota bacterium]